MAAARPEQLRSHLSGSLNDARRGEQATEAQLASTVQPRRKRRHQACAAPAARACDSARRWWRQADPPIGRRGLSSSARRRGIVAAEQHGAGDWSAAVSRKGGRVREQARSRRVAPRAVRRQDDGQGALGMGSGGRRGKARFALRASGCEPVKQRESRLISFKWRWMAKRSAKAVGASREGRRPSSLKKRSSGGPGKSRNILEPPQGPHDAGQGVAVADCRWRLGRYGRA